MAREIMTLDAPVRVSQILISGRSSRWVRAMLKQVNEQRIVEGKAGFLYRNPKAPTHGWLMVNMAILREACPTLDVLALASRDDLDVLRTELLERLRKQHEEHIVWAQRTRAVGARLRVVERQLKIPGIDADRHELTQTGT